MKTKFLSVLVILIAVVVAVVIVLGRNETSRNRSESLLGREIPVLSRNHVPEGTKVAAYNSNPPTSGDHWPQPANWGLYTEPFSDEQLVHNLEHGGIWISFKDVRSIDEATGKKLEDIANEFPEAVVITERSENETQFAIASWGRLYTSDTFDQEFTEKFIQSNINNSPEQFASLEQAPTGALAVGASFPDFRVTEVDGRTITQDLLKGKPAIIWFTTSWCVPCQIGAEEVSRLDDELGGDSFEVLVIFVDLKETDADLVNWRKQFANPDWMVAFDNESTDLAQRIGLKFLDSKFLIDKNGVIQNIDFQIADEKYLNVIRQMVKEGE